VLCIAREALATGSLPNCEALRPLWALWESVLECYNEALWCMETTREAQTTHRAYTMLINRVVLPHHKCADRKGFKLWPDAEDHAETSDEDETSAWQAAGELPARLPVAHFRAWRRASADARLERSDAAAAVWDKAQALCGIAHAVRERPCAGVVLAWQEHTARARTLHAQGQELAQRLRARTLRRCCGRWKQLVAAARTLHAQGQELAQRLAARALRRCCGRWKQLAVAESSSLAWRYHTFQRKHARARGLHTMRHSLVAWKQQAVQFAHPYVATRRVARVLAPAWQQWKHRIGTAGRARAKYGACARRLLATARDMGFVARAAWRNGLRAQRAQVARFARRLRLHKLWVLFEVLACPVVRRKNMNEMCRRRHLRRLRGGFDSFVSLENLKKWQLLEFEMQARKDCAEALDRIVARSAAPAAAEALAPAADASTPAAVHASAAHPRQPEAELRVVVATSISLPLAGCEAPWRVTFDLPSNWPVPRPAQARVCLDMPAEFAAERGAEHMKPVFCACKPPAHGAGTVSGEALESLASACRTGVLPLRADEEEESKEQNAPVCHPSLVSENVTTALCILHARCDVLLACAGEPRAALGLHATVVAAFTACAAGRHPVPPCHWMGQALYLGAKIRPHNLGMPPEQVVRLAVDFVRMESEEVGSRRQPLALHAVHQVVRSIQAVRGCESTGVPKDTLIWWAAITEATVRWRKPWRLLRMPPPQVLHLSMHPRFACTGCQRGHGARDDAA